ncbi:hypothetical protein [Chromobacterium sp.]|uniref:nSTAND3 domain-containing NTPase n=1 Tax=Chromobacterium sp. TaxID=306190 RepID=UPI0035AF6468
MTDYDFKTLNDKEFEVFCSDLLSIYLDVRIERFKPGRDSGIDGRYFGSDNKEIILQYKHWANTPIKSLISFLRKEEKPKLDKLQPNRYILAISAPLSRTDKKSIAEALGNHINSESDIFGKEDLNDLLSKNSDIEKRHYKLWLCSTNVISHILNKAIFERSEFSHNAILASAKKYVETSAHHAAIEKLEKLGAIIISGEPGIGKTTLAEHLCLHYIDDGYEFIKIEDDVKEAEDALTTEKKQIFYFDDFLGRNYFEAISGRASSKIVGFIRRISSDKKHKRFILTSRSTVLNQGKVLVDCFQNHNLDRNEFELTVNSLSEIEKARILYNHIWHTDLPANYVDELYIDKRYKKIISHKNFNPRLINFITDVNRLETTPAKSYWSSIESALSNPADIWENPFIAQQDDFGRSITLLVTLNGRQIEESELATAYNRLLSYPENAGLQGRRDFLTNLKYLTGSLLTRHITQDGSARLDLFNPSLGDYILRRYACDIPSLKLALKSLRSMASLTTLSNLLVNKMINQATHSMILQSIIEEGSSYSFIEYKPEYIARATMQQINQGNRPLEKSIIKSAVDFISNEDLPNNYDDIIDLITYSIRNEITNQKEAKKYIKLACEVGVDYSSLTYLAELCKHLDKEDESDNAAKKELDNKAIQYLSETISDDIDDQGLFSNVDYGDYYQARKNVEALIEARLDEFGVNADASIVQEILSHCDYEEALDSFFHANYDVPDYRQHENKYYQLLDDVDDLFDRR